MTFGEFPSSSERRVRLIELMSMGVQIPCDDGIIVGEDCYIGEGTLILPGCIIMNGTRIGRGCVIGPGSVLSACEIDDGVEFLHSWADRAVIESGVKIGPFARLRPKAWIEKNVKIGNFVEIKNSQIGEKSKVSHLSYIGDTQMSEGCNVGCGCATANFDGKEKHKTNIGADCFIGCDSTLVAPVTLGKNVYTAAGSVITENVPDGALVFARARQVNKTESVFWR